MGENHNQSTVNKTVNATLRMSADDWELLREKASQLGLTRTQFFYSNSEGTDKTRTWTTPGGQTTPGGIRRRLNELHKACLILIESQQRQLEFSLQESKKLAEEMQNLQAVLSEVSESFSEEE
ncbi:hypothetical protein ACX27_14685 [Nostoc piscinale CENA21]|uniref:Uncharacterized protein n=1 Tax=Nostoc piscinale CENA21 TaxID=224013 RepID=A0A0M4T1B4_9NOSO|nr:hypothetical protein [Nostoc piscinale]ALF52970.1 hypothetical protein ACX27_09095 [Nostoc piscinale CENA21]ALF53811.1 hypothetical protein ACX27_14685 [Nostoc piscinale CENA21]